VNGLPLASSHNAPSHTFYSRMQTPTGMFISMVIFPSLFLLPYYGCWGGLNHCCILIRHHKIPADRCSISVARLGHCEQQGYYREYCDSSLSGPRPSNASGTAHLASVSFEHCLGRPVLCRPKHSSFPAFLIEMRAPVQVCLHTFCSPRI